MLGLFGRVASKVSLSDVVSELSRGNKKILDLDKEITELGVRIQVMQEHRACLAELCREEEKRLRGLMHFVGKPYGRMYGGK